MSEHSVERQQAYTVETAATSPSLLAPRLSYVRALFLGVPIGMMLGGAGGWVCTVAWFVVYGGEDVGTDIFTGMLLGVFPGVFFGLGYSLMVVVPTTLVVAWQRNRAKSVDTVRRTAALLAGGGMLFLILVSGNSMTSSGPVNGEQRVSFGWVVPVVATLWSAGWAYVLSVWRPPVVVEPDGSGESAV